MTFKIEPERGEKVIFTETIPEEVLGEPFAIGLTDQAVYFPRKKRFAVRDPYVTVRLLLSDVTEIRARRVFSWAPLAFGLGLAAFWLITGISDYHEGRFPWASLESVAMVIFVSIGLLGRRALVVTTVRGAYVWKRPIRVKWKGRALLDDVFERFLAACKASGVQVNAPTPHASDVRV